MFDFFCNMCDLFEAIIIEIETMYYTILPLSGYFIKPVPIR